MTKVNISCPYCGFSTDTEKTNIPEKTVNAICPKCKKSFPFTAHYNLKDEKFKFNEQSENVNINQYAKNESKKFAGFWIRLLAFTIDSLLWFALSVAIILTFDFSNFFSVIQNGDTTLSASIIFFGVITFILFSIASVLYYVVCWEKCGKTFGMLVAGIKVISVEGGYLTTSKALLRWFLGYFLPVMLPYIGGFAYIALGIMIGADSQKQGWHDKAAKSYVIYG